MAPQGQSTRPTADRVRQAMFDVLAHAAWAPPLEGARVADLFAGSGALGLEALSRGAAAGLFIDRAPASIEAIEANLRALRLQARATALRADVTRLSACRGAAYDFVFMDPPYGEGLGETALPLVLSGNWLTASGVAVLERGLGEPALIAPGFEVIDARQWGRAEVLFFRPV